MGLQNTIERESLAAGGAVPLHRHRYRERGLHGLRGRPTDARDGSRTGPARVDPRAVGAGLVRSSKNRGSPESVDLTRGEPPVPDVLIFGDSKSAYLRHELPLSLPDPAAYIERDGRRYAIGGSLDIPRLEALGALDVISFEELGLDEALAGGTSLAAGLDDCLLRALRRLGVTDACVPADFPLGTADHLRAGGVAVLVDGELFGLRRRSKTAEQIEGVRRAQRVAELAMESVRAGLREGGDLSSEELRAGAKRVFVDNGCVPHDLLRPLLRPAERTHPRRRRRADPPARADPGRHLPARRCLRLLGGHHEDVLRRAAPRGARRVPPSRPRGPAQSLRDGQARDQRGRALPGRLRGIRGGRIPDASHEGRGDSARGRLRSLPGPWPRPRSP